MYGFPGFFDGEERGVRQQAGREGHRLGHRAALRRRVPGEDGEGVSFVCVGGNLLNSLFIVILTRDFLLGDSAR